VDPGGLSVVVDCANGATSAVAPQLLEGLGVRCRVLFASPDGVNINRGCGSEHPEALSRQVRESGADLGLAFDGDGDRLIAVDEKGEEVSGDEILAVFARHLSRQGALDGGTVVSTTMSNMGLTEALEGLGLRHVTCGVGDRHVMEAMRKNGAVLGGENSGHLIFLSHHTTGDGLLSALKLLEVVAAEGKPLGALRRLMKRYPQVLLAVEVREKPPLESLEAVLSAVEAARRGLGQRGRVLVRYSGTQPVCRVMVEGPDPTDVREKAETIAAAVKRSVGAA
jgi:phosphoglucosamine mutase